MRTADVLGVRFDCMTMDELVEEVDRLIAAGRGQIAFANPEFVIEAQHNHDLRAYLESCAFCVADGVGVMWAARRLQRMQLPQRVTGTDFLPRLFDLSARRGYGIYVLGGKPGIAEKAVERLTAGCPQAKVVGVHHGYFEDDDRIVGEINASGAEILMVCLGNPRQEAWIARNRKRLKPALTFGNGGALDIHAGVAQRAPGFVRRMGFEWLWRLTQQPTMTRLRRQSRLIVFVWRVLRARPAHATR